MLGAAGPADRCPGGDTTSVGSVEPPAAGHGEKVVLSGGGFAPSSEVQLILCSAPLTLGTAVTDAAGALRPEFVVPAGADIGAHRVVAVGHDADGGVHVSVADFTIVPRVQPSFTG